ncbi:putative serine carboxypeptidase CPVL [Tubulanus polymorphus]|uniref:putative serine carboxypeptidase CPVL n=1 Tax=Tubulanus polymorphus TaxID=672921 RepID=UPI003DA61311
MGTIFQAQHANLLIVDSPVGTGFSYVDNNNKLVTTFDGMVDDLKALIVQLYNVKYPAWKNMDTYIFGESLGGAVAVLLEEKLHSMNFDYNLKKIVLAASGIDIPKTLSTHVNFGYHFVSNFCVSLILSVRGSVDV